MARVLQEGRIMRTWRGVVVAAMLVLTGLWVGSRAPEALAQGETGTLVVTVNSPELDTPLEGVTVQIEGTSIAGMTDDDGVVTLTVPPGRWVIVVEFMGFQTVQTPVVMRRGETTPVSISLEVESGLGEPPPSQAAPVPVPAEPAAPVDSGLRGVEAVAALPSTGAGEADGKASVWWPMVATLTFLVTLGVAIESRRRRFGRP
jgi:hypothetical protein